jgi:hypothetical protein
VLARRTFYYDLSDSTETTGGTIPHVDDSAEKWFGPVGKDRHVVAVGPALTRVGSPSCSHRGRAPMTELQALLDRLGLAER